MIPVLRVFAVLTNDEFQFRDFFFRDEPGKRRKEFGLPEGEFLGKSAVGNDDFQASPAFGGRPGDGGKLWTDGFGPGFFQGFGPDLALKTVTCHQVRQNIADPRNIPDPCNAPRFYNTFLGSTFR